MDYKCKEDFEMKEKLKINVTKPQYVQVSDITYAQVDSWYDHCRRDLKLDLIYPEDMSDKRYPCIVWICGGGWMRIDKSAHLSYLSTLAHQGFVVLLSVTILHLLIFRFRWQIYGWFIILKMNIYY